MNVNNAFGFAVLREARQVPRAALTVPPAVVLQEARHHRRRLHRLPVQDLEIRKIN